MRGGRVECDWANVDETTQSEGKALAEEFEPGDVGGSSSASSRPDGDGRSFRNGPLSILCQAEECYESARSMTTDNHAGKSAQRTHLIDRLVAIERVNRLASAEVDGRDSERRLVGPDHAPGLLSPAGRGWAT